MKQGTLQIYTGDGKGKTTAAAGLALRAAGAGLRVFIGQFIKSKDSAEMELLRKLSDRVTIEQFGRGGFIIGVPSPEDRNAAKHGISRLMQALVSNYNLVIADEALGALSAGLVTPGELIDFVDTRPADTELVITGRNAPAELIEKADLVTEMRCIKHYYDNGIPARPGIEY